MAKNPQTNDYLTKGLRWTARIVGLLANGLFLLFLIESGPRVIPELTWSDPRGLPLLVAMIVAAVGVLIAWRWEMVGGAMAVVGTVAILILVYLGAGTHLFRATMILIVPLLVPGMLFLVCYWRTSARPPAGEVVVTEAYSGNGVAVQTDSR